MKLVEEIYTATQRFPQQELYGLTSQVRRAAVSVPSNIAEGHGRSGSREFIHRLSIALGSLAEVETQVLIAKRLGYIGAKETERILDLSAETARITIGLRNSLERNAKAS